MSDNDNDNGSQSDTKLTVPRKKRERKILYLWNRHTESALIAAVHQHPVLWDNRKADNKIRNYRIDSWKQVAANLCVDGVDDVEARLKWQSLRSHFKSHLAKYRSEQEQSIETPKASWPHLHEMMFVESPEVIQSYPITTSTVKLEDEYDECSISNELTQMSYTESCLEADQSSVPIKRQKTETASPTPPPSLSRNYNSDSFQNLVAEVLGNIARRQDDHFCVFGELVSSHLRRLPEEVAFNLEGRIMQLIYSESPHLHTNVIELDT